MRTRKAPPLSCFLLLVGLPVAVPFVPCRIVDGKRRVSCIGSSEDTEDIIVPSSSSSNVGIHVWDNVLPVESRALLHQTASAQGLGHTLLKRGDGISPVSPLEQALDQILHQLGDASAHVEYWSRQEWRSIEAHADVDEYRARQDKVIRYPTHGHVLYLQVGPKVRGPTCLFPHCRSGGDLAKPQKHDERNKRNLSVLTVPAVSGRLLRFPGHWLHAVPRPTDLWMLPFVQGSPDFADEFQRSVVLFNTWPNEPPLQVEPLSQTSKDKSTGGVNDGTSRLVNDLVDWNQQETADSPVFANFSDRAKIWLLGDLTRRNYTMRTVPVFTSGDVLRRALHEESQPKATPLSREPMEAT